MKLRSKQRLFCTGIKVLDLLLPYKKGAKIGLFGGAGVGERTREGNDLYYEMQDSGIIRLSVLQVCSHEIGQVSITNPYFACRLSQVVLVFGQMNETPRARIEGRTCIINHV